MITKEEVAHVGWLSRIDIRESEAEDYAEKLNSVLDYFSQLDEVDTENILPTYHVANVINVFREDKIGTSMTQDEVLINTEHEKDGNFKAPKIM